MLVNEKYGAAAQEWYNFGFSVIPILPGKKTPACKWDPWLEGLSGKRIAEHWAENPDHELGYILGDTFIVFDADSPEAIRAFNEIMDAFDLNCNLVNSTQQGEHYVFRRAPGTIAKSDSHDTKKHPERLDIKTGRAMVVLPPSTGKTINIQEAETASELTEVNQAFIDAVFRHNARGAPTPVAQTIQSPSRHLPNDMAELSMRMGKVLAFVDPDSGYEDWLRTGMAIHYESDGDRAGLEIYDQWSSRGKKYRSRTELETKYASFGNHTGARITVGSVYQLAVQGGAEPEFVQDLDDLAGLPLLTETTFSIAEKSSNDEHDLAKYSLRGMGAQLEAEMLAHVFILGQIAILGQWAVIYASPNTGKTLIVLWLLIDAIERGNIKPENLFYINADDSHAGLTAKLRLAEKHGFHMLSPGYLNFRAGDFLKLLRALCAKGRARGTIVILDTLKKFTDLMDKRTASDFGSAIREFIAQGGTVIALAHTNKKRNSDGKPIPGGTSDIVDDADCVYLMYAISDEDDIRTVQFENIKSRGMVAKRAAYQYSTREGVGYLDLLASVAPVDDAKASAIQQAADRLNLQDVPLVQAITDCINGGVTSKTKIVEQAASATGESQRHVQRVLEERSGPDPEAHYWKFTIGPRGVHLFELHPISDDAPDIEEL